MAKSATAHPGKAHSADDTTSIAAGIADHNKTMEGLGRVESEVIGGVQGVDTKIHARRREIWDNKGSRVPQEVKFSDLVWGNNVRPADSLALEPMIHSLKNNGYDPKYPIVVSKKAHGKLLVLNGNRRTEGLKRIRDTEPAIFDIVLPGKDHKLPALVLENLSEDEEALIRIDHGKSEDRVGLTEEGIFLAVKQLVHAGYASQSDVAAQLDLFKENPQTKVMEPNRSYIQARVTLARLPGFMQAEFVKLMKGGKNATPVRWSQVPQLFKVFEPERKMGYFGETVEKCGPQTQAKWKECMTPEEKDPNDPANQEKDRAMTKTKLEEVSGTLGSRLGKLFLLKIAGNPVKDIESGKMLEIADIDGQMVEAEAAIHDLMSIRDDLGDSKYDAMIVRITKKRQAEAKKAAAAEVKVEGTDAE